MLARRIIKHIDDEAKREPEKYIKWFEDFGQFIREGIATDQDNRDALLKLLRVRSRNNGAKKRISIEDYISKMKEGQEKIYFITDASYERALNSPYFEPLKDETSIDVLIITDPMDEVLF